MDWLPRLKIYRSTLESAKLTPTRRGILAHLCLEHLRLSAPSRQASLPPLPPLNDEARDAILLDVRRAVRQGMRLFPMPLEEPEAVEQDMADCLFWFACLPEASVWLARGRREQGIADAAGRMHRVDLLVDPALPEQNTTSIPLHAIDYKTGRFPEAEIAREHHNQVRRYMRLLREAKARPVCGSLVYLDAREVIAVNLEEA